MALLKAQTQRQTVMLVPFVERTEARKSETPRAADIREGLVILECNEAFENTELSLLNAQVQQPAARLGVELGTNFWGRRSAATPWLAAVFGISASAPMSVRFPNQHRAWRRRADTDKRP